MEGITTVTSKTIWSWKTFLWRNVVANYGWVVCAWENLFNELNVTCSQFNWKKRTHSSEQSVEKTSFPSYLKKHFSSLLLSNDLFISLLAGPREAPKQVEAKMMTPKWVPPLERNKMRDLHRKLEEEACFMNSSGGIPKRNFGMRQ